MKLGAFISAGLEFPFFFQVLLPYCNDWNMKDPVSPILLCLVASEVGLCLEVGQPMNWRNLVGSRCSWPKIHGSALLESRLNANVGSLRDIPLERR